MIKLTKRKAAIGVGIGVFAAVIAFVNNAYDIISGINRWYSSTLFKNHLVEFLLLAIIILMVLVFSRQYRNRTDDLYKEFDESINSILKSKQVIAENFGVLKTQIRRHEKKAILCCMHSLEADKKNSIGLDVRENIKQYLIDESLTSMIRDMKNKMPYIVTSLKESIVTYLDQKKFNTKKDVRVLFKSAKKSGNGNIFDYEIHDVIVDTISGIIISSNVSGHRKVRDSTALKLSLDTDRIYANNNTSKEKVGYMSGPSNFEFKCCAKIVIPLVYGNDQEARIDGFLCVFINNESDDKVLDVAKLENDSIVIMCRTVCAYINSIFSDIHVSHSRYVKYFLERA